MGDMSAEPSMEDILSSIKRIIAEEGEGTQARGRRQQRAAAPAPRGAAPAGEEEVLELSDPIPLPDPELDTPVKMTRPPPAARTASGVPPSAVPAEPILSQETAAASRGALETLSRLMVRPEPGSDGTLEGLVQDMLRPMLRAWLDANLPQLVETLVAREIEKITTGDR